MTMCAMFSVGIKFDHKLGDQIARMQVYTASLSDQIARMQVYTPPPHHMPCSLSAARWCQVDLKDRSLQGQLIFQPGRPCNLLCVTGMLASAGSNNGDCIKYTQT